MQEIINKGMAEGVAPAIVLTTWSVDSDLQVLSAGQAGADTVFDLASLTKPLATAIIALDMASDGVLPFEAQLGSVWGDVVPADKQGVSVGQLLCHTAGFAAYKPFFQALEEHPSPSARRGLLKAMLLNDPLANRPGEAVVYSDLGYMLLGLLLEEAAGVSLDLALAQTMEKLGVDAPRFLPMEDKPYWPLERIAPCGPLPGREVVHGQVEDGNAFAMGGVAGHAGLFGTAGQVAELAKALCRAAGGGGPWPIDMALRLLKKCGEPKGCPRTPGFDTPSGPDSAAGPNPPDDTVGHLGFTGTSLWMSPKTGCGVVLLTNRVAFGRGNDKIAAFRQEVHQAAWQYLGA